VIGNNHLKDPLKKDNRMKKVKSIRKHIPVGVLLIAAFYLFGAIVLIINLFTNRVAVSRNIAASHGLSPAVDGCILPIVASLALLISYGLFTRSRWGFFLTIIYLLFFGSVSLWMLSQRVQQPYIGNLIWSLLVLIYLVWKRKYFISAETN
jgi:hypothetical protein